MKQIDDEGIEQAAIAEWNRNAAIRAEFFSQESFIAYCKASAKGLVKTLGAGKGKEKP